MLVDTHCHLYVEEFDTDRDSMIRRAMDAGVKKFYLPAIDSNTTAAMLKLEETYPGTCIAMAGLHPCSVKENYEQELAQVNDMISKRNFAAIGEIGLDFYWDKTFTKEQYDAFHRQIGLAISLNIPIVIHTREAMKETIGVVKEYKGKVKGIFHCFGGTLEDAEEIIGMGFLLGIGGVVTYKNSGVAAVVKEISLEHIVLETDAPYLTPVPFRGKRNESSYIAYIRDAVAGIKNTSPEAVADITTANALKVFPL